MTIDEIALRRWAIEQASVLRWDDDEQKIIAFAEKLIEFVKGDEETMVDVNATIAVLKGLENDD